MRTLIKLTSEELEQIDLIAKARYENAKKTSRQYSWGNKPAPKNHKRDILGLCGEWVIKKYLQKAGMNIIDDSTRETKSRKSKDDCWDFTFSDKELNTWSLEVKTTKTLMHAHLLIPKHRRKYASDLYCLVKKLNKETFEICGFIKKEEAFEIYNKDRASPCYETHEDLLLKLNDIIGEKNEKRK